jgi:hypothetical protein
VSVRRYVDEAAFRRALEDKIRSSSRERSISVVRLRKEIGFQRLLARFIDCDSGAWALKGGVSLLWRVSAEARATRDVDANWRLSLDELGDFLTRVVRTDLGDGFEFQIDSGHQLQGEAEGGFRYHVVARLDGREFEAFPLDVNLVLHDRRPVEVVDILVPVLSFVGLERLSVPMISVPQQLAEKLHAVGRSYQTGDSTRPKDAYDTAVLIQSAPALSLNALRRAVSETFAIRGDPIPDSAPLLPDLWQPAIEEFLLGFSRQGAETWDEVVGVWRAFWNPVLSGGDAGLVWNPDGPAWH